MGKKRKLLSPTNIKAEIKEDRGPGHVDVVNARDRLTGALQELLIQSDESSSSSNEDTVVLDHSARHVSTKKPLESGTSSSQSKLLRRKRRRREAVAEGQFHHTYVMKLFDRSVDLAQFQEDTPLYPVCRAWMANQPHNKNLVPKMRTPTPEPPPEELASLESAGSGGESDSETVREIYKMPPPRPKPAGRQTSLRIPSPIPRDKEDLNLDSDVKPCITREALLEKHRARWGAVRKKWYNASRLNEERYADSGRILRAIYRKAQRALCEEMIKQEI